MSQKMILEKQQNTHTHMHAHAHTHTHTHTLKIYIKKSDNSITTKDIFSGMMDNSFEGTPKLVVQTAVTQPVWNTTLSYY